MVEINFHHAYPLLTVGWVKIVAHHSMQNQFGLKRTAKSIWFEKNSKINFGISVKK